MVPFVLSPGHRSEPMRWLCSRCRSHTLNLNDRWSNWKRKEYCFFCFKYEDESREYNFLRLLGRLWVSIHWVFVICFSRCDFSSLSLQCLTLTACAHSYGAALILSLNVLCTTTILWAHTLLGLASGASMCLTVPFSLIRDVLCLCSSLHMKPKFASKF